MIIPICIILVVLSALLFKADLSIGKRKMNNTDNINKEYVKLTNMADQHIQTLKSKKSVENEQTLAAVMFIQSHKNYIRCLFKNEKIRTRQDAAVKFIASHVKNFNADVVRKELTKIGLYSHKRVRNSLFVILNLLYLVLTYFRYILVEPDIFGIFVADSLGLYFIYFLICFGLGAKFCSSKVPLYLYKDI